SYVTSAPGRLAPHYLIATYPVTFAVQGLAVSDVLRGLRRRAGVQISTILAAGVVALVVTSYVAYTVSFHRFLGGSGGAAGDYGVVYRDKRALARVVRDNGLHVANEPTIEFLVAGTMEETPSPGPFAIVRDTLKDKAPLPCREPVRAFG